MKITVNDRKQGQFIEVTLEDDYICTAMAATDEDLPDALRKLAREIDMHLNEEVNKPDAAA